MAGDGIAVSITSLCQGKARLSDTGFPMSKRFMLMLSLHLVVSKCSDGRRSKSEKPLAAGTFAADRGGRGGQAHCQTGRTVVSGVPDVPQGLRVERARTPQEGRASSAREVHNEERFKADGGSYLEGGALVCHSSNQGQPLARWVSQRCTLHNRVERMCSGRFEQALELLVSGVRGRWATPAGRSPSVTWWPGGHARRWLGVGAS